MDERAFLQRELAAERARARAPKKGTEERKCGAYARSTRKPCQAPRYRRADGTIATRCRMHGGNWKPKNAREWELCKAAHKVWLANGGRTVLAEHGRRTFYRTAARFAAKIIYGEDPRDKTGKMGRENSAAEYLTGCADIARKLAVWCC